MTPALPTRAITAQIRAIRDYAKEHDAQKVIIQGEMLSALEDLLPPGSPIVHSLCERRAARYARRTP
jgi:hypothetical protein